MNEEDRHGLCPQEANKLSSVPGGGEVCSEGELGEQQHGTAPRSQGWKRRNLRASQPRGVCSPPPTELRLWRQLIEHASACLMHDPPTRSEPSGTSQSMQKGWRRTINTTCTDAGSDMITSTLLPPVPAPALNIPRNKAQGSDKSDYFQPFPWMLEVRHCPDVLRGKQASSPKKLLRAEPRPLIQQDRDGRRLAYSTKGRVWGWLRGTTRN